MTSRELSPAPGDEVDRAALLAVASGKMPAAAVERLFVGRSAERQVFGYDLDRIAAGGSTIRLLIGELGAGKTTLLHSLGAEARKLGFATMTASLSPEHLLAGNNGEDVSLLTGLLLNFRTLGSSEECAIEAVVARFAEDCEDEAAASDRDVSATLAERLQPLERLPRGFAFRQVMTQYALALLRQDSIISGRARRWFLGGFSSTAEAKDELGIPNIPSGGDLWPMLKLWASFVRIAGRKGLVVFLDEVRLIADMHAPVTRQQNFEQLLMMFNELAGGAVAGLGLVMGATPHFLNAERGLGSFELLNTCVLAGGGGELADQLMPPTLLRLSEMSEAELVELLGKYRDLLARCHPQARLIPPDELSTFLDRYRSAIGSVFRPTRAIVQGFVEFHNRLAANPNVRAGDLLLPQGGGSELPHRLLTSGNAALRKM